MSRLLSEPPSAAAADQLTIHDFVRVDAPFDAIAGAFVHHVSPELIGRLVLQAWTAELTEASEELVAETHLPEARAVDVWIGSIRTRSDALIIPIAWRPMTPAWVPPLQADLEVVAFGPRRSHLHVLGRSALRDGVVPSTYRASLDQRLTVAMVRRFLDALAHSISSS
jgi:hypothetical protein